MGAMGACGMFSAGFIGNPAIGYQQDYHASTKLEAIAPDTYERYRAPHERSFLIFPAVAGLDGTKVEALEDKVKEKKQLTAEESRWEVVTSAVNRVLRTA